MKYILVAMLSFFMILFSGCNQKTKEQLDLEQALSACDAEVQKTYKNDIKTQKKLLRKKEINEKQFKKFLSLTKNLVKCG